MASFTDKTPTFNPYVQQLPVEEMVKVGMQKQQQYNEGYQKIQSNIDNVAGLDVARDVDKKYLESKLNALGNNLKTVAAGDFSNFQLVNSVNGMTNQITKDENVINAVQSTKIYKKGLAEMNEANKSGKGNASNSWLFKTEANQYLSSDDVTASFNGGYKQFTDYKKNALEVIKSLVKNETTKDVSLEFDENGNVTGVLDATTRTKIAGITPERIQSALMVGLSTNDFQQMQIDGRYNYSNTTDQEFTDDIIKTHNLNYTKYNDQRVKLKNAYDSSNSIQVKAKIQEQIDSLDKTINKLNNDYKTVNKSIESGDIESAKAKLHTTNWINTFSQTFANQELSQTDESNPYQQVAQYRETKALDYKKWLAEFNQDEAHHQDDLYFKRKEDQRADAKAAIEAAGAAGYGGLPFSVNQSELPSVTLGRVVNDIKNGENIVAAKDASIMKKFGKDGDKQWLQDQLMAWQASPKSVDVRLADHFNTTERTRREIAANQAMVDDINQKANEQFEPITNFIPKGMKSLVLTSASRKMTFTPTEVVNFNDKLKNYTSVKSASVGTGGVSSITTFDTVRAKQELTPKEFYLFTLKLKENKKGKNSLLPDEKAVLHYSTYLQEKVNSPYRKISKDKNAFVANEVKNRVVAMQGMEYGIPLNNEAQKTTFGNALVGFANLADSQNGGLPNSPNLDTSDLRKIAGDLQNATIRIVEGTAYAPGMYEVTAAKKDGTTQTFRVPPEAYRSIFKDKFEASPEIQAVRPILSQMIRTGEPTTALDGKRTNINNAYLGKLDFSNVDAYGVSANVIKSENNGLYSIRLNLTDPITKKIIVQDFSYPSKGWIDEGKIQAAISGLDDSKIFQMIYNRAPTSKELQKLKQASQNPY